MSARGTTAIERALAERDATAFVHVGGRRDPDFRYLSGLSRLDERSAYVQTAAGERLLCPAAGDEDIAEAAFDGRVRPASEFDAGAPGERAAELLGERDVAGDGETVLVTPTVPHATAVYLERAGISVASTDALERARAVKDEDEVARVRAVQEAATAGVARAERLLAESDVGADGLVHENDAVTTGWLVRQVDAALAEAGVSGAENTLVATGTDAATPRLADDKRVQTGETVLVDVAPRGPEGYHGRLARTFVVESEGGWDRRAHLAVTRAREAGLDEVAAGTAANVVHTETAAEVMAYGFDVGPDAPNGFSGTAGYGIGLDTREAPSLATNDELAAGHVIALAPEVLDPKRGGIRVADTVLVTADGYEVLADYPTSITPTTD
ncbi:M24 family metallopeptidase [Halarchaeum sp. P4]|uniref:M24 family metallopeptidase n=1 Tax=Halarchaeum sp. P4 TaxID=3421639 RepID=UPI003EC03586